MTYGLNDITLVPARISDIKSRKECNPYNFDNMLPLFTAPMNAVINTENYQTFLDNKINTIIPRGVNLEERFKLATKTFVALGLQEFITFIKTHKDQLETSKDTWYICVDIANGHMRHLIDLCVLAKEIFGGRLLLMAGNIANPETYVDYALAGIDFVRASVGSGSACITSANGGIHYGVASLIKELADKKWEVEQCIEDSQKLRIQCKYKSVPYIVADGGFDNYDKIIKALALGADYVMVGKLFAQSEEACGNVTEIQCADIDMFRNTHRNIPQNVLWKSTENRLYSTKVRAYYGMSTKKAQLETGNTTTKTSEGIEIVVPILYTLEGWCENFIDYLRSMMSYANSKTLTEFKNTQYKIVSFSEYLTFNK